MESHRRTATFLLALFAVLILYGSFYPFRFDAQYAAARFSEPASKWLVTHMRLSRMDIILNVLGYVPIGLLLVFVLPSRWGWLRTLCTGVLLGGMLSLSAEIAQNAFIGRDPSINDLITNVLGTAAGLAAGLWLRDRAPQIFGTIMGAVPVAAVALLLLWLSLHAAPFLPSGFYRLRRAIEELVAWNWSARGIAKWIGAWALFQSILRALLHRRYFFGAFGALAILSLGIRLLIRDQHLSPDEIIGLALSVPLLAASSPLLPLVALVAGIFIDGLAPFRFDGSNTFSWIPFGGMLGAPREAVLQVVLEKTYLTLGSVWLMTRTGFAPVHAGICMAVLLLVLELVQIVLPGRTPEITDPLLALISILLVQQPGPPKQRRRRKAT